MKFKKFTKEKRSGFLYWFWHWLAFNYVAWKLNAWELKWLFHDIEKPWLKLFWQDYKKVQKWHRYHNNHHIVYGRLHGYNKINWLAAIIDWECSRYTKEAAPRTAREEVEFLVDNGYKGAYTLYERLLVKENCFPILDTLGL